MSATRQTLQILGYLAAQRGPASASSMAQALGIPRSTIYRLLDEMIDLGFVLHFPEARRYGMGIAAFELSSGYSRQEPLARLGRPILSSLADRVGESAHLAVLHGRDVLYLIEERAPRRPMLVTDVGVRLPSHLTASGRAQLAALPASQLRALFPSGDAFAERDGRGSVSSYGELKRVLATVRSTGFAVEDGEVTEGIASVAVPVLDHTGWPAAGIAVTFSKSEVEPSRWPDIAAEVRRHADLLARRIRGS